MHNRREIYGKMIIKRLATQLWGELEHRCISLGVQPASKSLQKHMHSLPPYQSLFYLSLIFMSVTLYILASLSLTIGQLLHRWESWLPRLTKSHHLELTPSDRDRIFIFNFSFKNPWDRFCPTLVSCLSLVLIVVSVWDKIRTCQHPY